MAAKYNIKVLHSTKKMPMQLEMVRENFKEIVNSLKYQETRQIEMELKIEELQTKSSIKDEISGMQNSLKELETIKKTDPKDEFYLTADNRLTMESSIDQKYEARTETVINFQGNEPDSFTLTTDQKSILVQHKDLKQVVVFQEEKIRLTLAQCLSRDGLSFCIADNYLAVRNLKKKQFEIVDIQTENVMVEHTYEDPWYYNNYHVLG